MAYSAPKIKRLPNPSNIPGKGQAPPKPGGGPTLPPSRGGQVYKAAALPMPRKANASNVPKPMGPSIAAQAATRARGAAARAATTGRKPNPSNVPKTMGPSIKTGLQDQLKKYKR